MAPTASNYDLFLSYNSADHGVVEDVARRLRAEGLKPFLDRWYLAPGARWRTKLEDTLSSSKAIAIFVGPGEMGSWQQREVDVALNLQSRSPNLPVIPVLIPGCEPPLGFIRQLTWVDLRTQTLDIGTAILAKAARGEAPGPDLKERLDVVRASICPYRGLFHFREEDAPFFFGREAPVDRLMDEVQRQPFVAMVGASGCGKSSVVRAGLIPRLRQTKAGCVWEFATLVPTDRPLHSLAAALVPILEPEMTRVDRLAEINKLAGHFAEGTVALRDVAADVLRAQPGTDRLLLFVDQWEELYTLAADDGTRRRFLAEILDASAKGAVTVVFTLRGDFFGQAVSDRSFADRLQGAQINLGPMTREELERAISRPAEKIQLEFEPGLVRRILNDVGDEPGNLPLLQFALEELWKNRRGRVLLNETYDGMGELKGALAKKAGEFFKSLSPPDQKVLQRVFLRIVRPSESGEDTRRRAAFSELPPEGKELVGKLTDERLLVTNQSASGLEQTVEVAHEALISNWSTLRAWLNEDRGFLLWRDRLGTLLKEWERTEENVDGLLRGPLLVEAQKWFDQRSQDLSDQERKFISASREERERLAREQKERQEREIESARKLAEDQKDSANKLRLRAWIAAGLALIAVIFAGAVALVWQKSESNRAAAEEQARIAETRRLAAQASENKANDARDQADGLINFMLYDLRDKLEPIGRLEVLDDVAKKAKGYLDSLPKELVTASRLKQQVAMLGNLGDVLVAQGKLQEALNAYQQYLAIAKRLAEQDKTNSGWQRDLSISYNKVGNVLMAQGKLQEAMEAYQQDLAIMKRLAEQDKTNSGWQRDLSVSYNKVGDVLVAQGKLQEALEAYQQGLAIAKALAEQDPTNAVWQNATAWSRYCVAKVLIRIKDGDRNEARRLVIEGIDIIKRLEHQGALDTNAQDTLNKLNEIATELTSSSRK